MVRGLALLVLAVVLGLAIKVATLVTEPVRDVNGVAVVVPDFTLEDGMTGDMRQRKDLLGEKFLLNVWATWCVACREEHEFLTELASQGIPIIGLYYRDSPASAVEWLNTKGNPYRVNLLDQYGVLADQLPVRGAPETYLINRYGQVVYKHSGILGEQHWRGMLENVYVSME